MLLPPRAPPGSPAPIVVAGAASGLHTVLLLLLPLLIRCSGSATTLYIVYAWLLHYTSYMRGYCPVLLLLLLLQLLLLLLCLEYIFAANPREHGKYASQPLSLMCLRIKEIRIHLLRKLYEYRLAIDIFFSLGGGLVPA